jgi:hypothetical protein
MIGSVLVIGNDENGTVVAELPEMLEWARRKRKSDEQIDRVDKKRFKVRLTASLWTSSQVKPASRVRKRSLSVYPASSSPTFPTAIMSPTAEGEE